MLSRQSESRVLTRMISHDGGHGVGAIGGSHQSIQDILVTGTQFLTPEAILVSAMDHYDADEMCSVESILKLEVDEGTKANPEHMVDAIKKCLEQVYIEAHEHSAPEWKQLADIMERDKSTSVHEAPIGDNGLVNFQCKIIPLDSLELDLSVSRDASLENALGRKKQQLLVWKDTERAAVVFPHKKVPFDASHDSMNISSSISKSVSEKV